MRSPRARDAKDSAALTRSSSSSLLHSTLASSRCWRGQCPLAILEASGTPFQPGVCIEACKLPLLCWCLVEVLQAM